MLLICIMDDRDGENRRVAYVCASIKLRSLARILSIFRLHFMDGVLSVLQKIPFQ